MNLHHHPTGAALLERAGDFLRRRETVHALLLTLAARAPEPGAAPYYLATVEDDAGVALVALRTPPHGVVLSALREGAPDAAIDLVVEDLARRGGGLPGAFGPLEVAVELSRRWEAATGARARVRLRMSVLELDRVIAPAWPPGELRLATERDLDLLVPWSNAFIDECGLPEEDRRMATRAAITRRIGNGLFRVWSVDGVAVTMAVGGSGSPARVGSVYTPPALRRRGYASACVAKLSQELLDRGAGKVVLSADAANPTSNEIYAAIGFRKVGDEAMIAFG